MTTQFKTLWLLAKPHAVGMAAGGVLACLAAFLEQATPVLLRAIVNDTFSRKVVAALPTFFALCLLLAVTQLMRVLQRLATERAATKLGAELFEKGIQHLLSHPLEWFYSHHSGALQVRLERSSRAVAEFLKIVLCDALPPMFSLLAAGMIMSRTDARVASVAGVTVTTLIALTIWQLRSQSGIRIEINHAREDQGVRVTESVLGIEQVKLFHAEPRESASTGRVSLLLANKEYQHHKEMALFDLFKYLVERAGFVCVVLFAVGAALSPGSTLGPGGVLMLVMLYERVTDPVRHLHRILDEGHERWMLAVDYLSTLNRSPVRTTPIAVHNMRPTSSSVLIEKVSFRYPEKKQFVLNEITLNIPAGSRTAIIGPSGSGKSTIGKLIAGLLPPTQGLVLLGGVPAFTAAHQTPALVGMLSQDVYIFADSILENVRYAQPDATLEQIIRACELAGLHSYIESLPGKYETMLGQRGTGLSGGQKQRLAWARLILQDPEIIVCDEPSSSVDADNANRFYREVLGAFQNKTVIVITHDLNNLEWADQVVLINNGCIAESTSLSWNAGSQMPDLDVRTRRPLCV